VFPLNSFAPEAIFFALVLSPSQSLLVSFSSALIPYLCAGGQNNFFTAFQAMPW